ncbi:FkbM family methyltransferase [Xanthomonas sp. 4461]|uniref:FkbM family methyltransferase n=1 Tax=Xanthomonas sp. 4461 TaxID=3035313 RepID=UPI002168EABF|nr:FkbM family methyltransferase [Xanthomonas sp. 4461]MCS3810976.1 FkbM family methyltransferase [Xanthomonas sp. 4461]
MLLLKQGRTEQAKVRLRQAIGLEPSNPQWQFELARLLRAEQPEQAVGLYAAAERLGSINAPLEAACLLRPQAVEWVAPVALWTPDRLDIAAKLRFAQHYLGQASDDAVDATALYRRHIHQRTAGQEPDALGKTCVADYELAFATLIEQVREQGFQTHCAIPIDGHGRLLNGAHRLAAALALGLETVPVIRLPAPWAAVDWGMAWFLHNSFAAEQINALLRSWLQWHAQRGRIVLIEHASGDDAMAVLRTLGTQFHIAAWRDVPAAVLAGLHHVQPGTALLRYVLLEGDEQALQAGLDAYVAQASTPLPCQVLGAQASQHASTLLLDETRLAVAHREISGPTVATTGIGQWTRYMPVTPAPSTDDRSGFVKWRNLELLKDVQTIIDVGVADGTPDLYRTLKPTHVVFIEPVTLFADQVERVRQQFPSSQYLQIGLSDREEHTFINYREDAPVLSSLLASSPLRDTGDERIVRLPVHLRRLDDVFAQLQGIDRTVLLKVDTEGYELQILRGAIESLRSISYVMLELSVIERFRGSYSCTEVVDFMQQNGFLLHTCLSASVDAQGHCRVVDVVFINTSRLQRTLAAAH